MDMALSERAEHAREIEREERARHRARIEQDKARQSKAYIAAGRPVSQLSIRISASSL